MKYGLNRHNNGDCLSNNIKLLEKKNEKSFLFREELNFEMYEKDRIVFKYCIC